MRNVINIEKAKVLGKLKHRCLKLAVKSGVKAGPETKRGTGTGKSS